MVKPTEGTTVETIAETRLPGRKLIPKPGAAGRAAKGSCEAPSLLEDSRILGFRFRGSLSTGEVRALPELTVGASGVGF